LHRAHALLLRRLSLSEWAIQNRARLYRTIADWQAPCLSRVCSPHSGRQHYSGHFPWVRREYRVRVQRLWYSWACTVKGIRVVRAVTSLRDCPESCRFGGLLAPMWACACRSASFVCRFVTASFWTAFVNSLAMILVCEIGDKTFFIGAIMAMQHPPVLVRQWHTTASA
jgi:hypothetical protein